MRRITFSLPWPLSAEHTREILSFIFQTAVVSYLFFFLLENLRPGFVSFFFNLGNFLWVAVVSGVLSSVWPALVPAAHRQPGRITWQDVVWIGLLSLGTMMVVWYKTAAIGWVAGVIAFLSALIVLGLSLLVYYDRGSDTEASR